MTYTIQHRWNHSKAAEEHVAVIFDYADRPNWSVSLPIKCRRAGLELETDQEIHSYVQSMYDALNPENWAEWKLEADKFWANSKSDVTKPIFDKLAENFDWLTYNELPTSSNPARRLQTLKEAGFTIGTRRRVGSDLEFILLPKLRGEQSGYEYWSGNLRKRIVKVLAKAQSDSDNAVRSITGSAGRSAFTDDKPPIRRMDGAINLLYPTDTMEISFPSGALR